ncbi:MAG: DNA primase [Candidatus Gracilibacteria bacterium]|nr:DNA primase [Candidatus Gracilibacteria bacterium]
MSIVDELENSIDIVDLVSKYAKLKKVGGNYKSLCPFPGHSEKTPSFVVSQAKQIAYCFGCHKGGGPIKFIMDIENCEFKDAVEILGNLTGVKVKGFENQKTQEQIKTEKNLYTLYKDVLNYYKSSLSKYSDIKKYVLDRGISEEMINLFSLGYSDDGVSLYNYLKEKGYEDQVISDSQIFLDLQRRKDKFIGRLIFPIKNHRGDVVAFAGRIIKSGEPKYINSPATKIYDKSNILYGFFDARQEISKKDFVIITEGYMDTISLHQHGFKNTVAVSGTALTEKHLTILKRITKKIYLCFDNDKAGEQATRLSLEILKNKGFEVKIIVLDGGKDPDEILKSGADFNQFIDKAVSPIGFLIKKSKFDANSFEDKRKVLEVLLDILKSYSDNIEKDFYIKEISILLDLPTNLIYTELNKIPNRREDIKEDNFIQVTSQDLAVAYVLIDASYKDYIKKELVFVDYVDNVLKEALDNEKFLDNLTLEKKEFYRGLSLELEDKFVSFTEDKIKDDIKKLCNKINSDVFKIESGRLKKIMQEDGNNLEALLRYSDLVKKAKSVKIV